MVTANIPTKVNQPDYNGLKKSASVTPYSPAATNGKAILDKGEDDIIDAFRRNPRLATAGLMQAATGRALYNGGATTTEAEKRANAAFVLNMSVAQNPRLANAALVKDAIAISLNDPDSFVRMRGQEVLQSIAVCRPDLVDATMLKAIKKAAAKPASDDLFDNLSREKAQRSLGFIAEDRPDLMTARQASAAKPSMPKVQAPRHAP